MAFIYEKYYSAAVSTWCFRVSVTLMSICSILFQRCSNNQYRKINIDIMLKKYSYFNIQHCNVLRCVG